MQLTINERVNTITLPHIMRSYTNIKVTAYFAHSYPLTPSLFVING